MISFKMGNKSKLASLITNKDKARQSNRLKVGSVWSCCLVCICANGQIGKNPMNGELG